jgi:hypothetical protein
LKRITQVSDVSKTLKSRFTQNRFILVFGALWLGAIGTGIGLLADYAAEPGQVGETLDVWPQDSNLIRDEDNYTILLAVHPRCPCTRATIEELEGVLAKSSITPQIFALIFEPSHDGSESTELSRKDEDFARTSISKKLSKLNGVELISDPGSLIAQSFGAMTSGHALVYSPTGSLVYSGGLTPTRAHVGPNTGSSTLLKLLTGGEPVIQDAPVYGCPLCPTEEDTDCYTQEVATP